MKRTRIQRMRSMTRLRVRPGDVFILNCEEKMSAELAEQIKKYLSKALRGAPCIVLSRGMQLSVVTGLPE